MASLRYLLQQFFAGTTIVKTGSPSNGEAIVFDGTNWTNAEVVAADPALDVDLTAPAAGDMLVYNGTDWVNLKRSKSVTFAAAAGNVAWNNMPAAETELFGFVVNRLPVDLLGFTQVRLVSSVRVAGVSGSKIYLHYATTFGGTYASIGTSAVENSLTNIATVDSGWINLAAGAKASDIWLKILGSGGDAVVDPNWGYIMAMFR